MGAFLHSGLTPRGLEDDEALVSAAHAGRDSRGVRNNNSDLKIILGYTGAPVPARSPVSRKCFGHRQK